MASVQFRLRSKANKNVAIKIRFSTGRTNDVEHNTGFSINPKDWSESTNLPKQNNDENKIIHHNLKKLESFIFKSMNIDMGNSIVIDFCWLELKINECFNRVEKTDESLIKNYIKDIIDNADIRKVKIKGGYKYGISKSRKNSFIATKNIISEYEVKTKKKIHFIDINEVFIEKFESWLLKTKKYAVNTSSKFIANIKTVCIEAEKKGMSVNTFAKQINIVSESESDRYIQTLSFAELDKIRTAILTNESHINARKWLLLGCEFGQRAEDLLSMTKENIRYNGRGIFLDLVQGKTNKDVTIGAIAPHVIDIIENEFPYKISIQKLNLYIKKVCEIAKIDVMTEGKIFNKNTGRKEFNLYEKHKLITSHCFRRSFCTNYYKLIPTPVLMAISGHTRESTFRAYINAPEDKDENANLFMEYQEKIHKDRAAKMTVILNTGTE